MSGFEVYDSQFGSCLEITDFHGLSVTFMIYSAVIVVVILVVLCFGRIEKGYKKYKARKQRRKLIVGEEESQHCFQNICWVLQQAEKAVMLRCLRSQTRLLIPFLYVVYALLYLVLVFINYMGHIFEVLEYLAHTLRVTFQNVFFGDFLRGMVQRREQVQQDDNSLEVETSDRSQTNIQTTSFDTLMEIRKTKGTKSKKKGSPKIMVTSSMQEEELMTYMQNCSAEVGPSHVMVHEKDSQQWKPILSKKQRKMKKSQQQEHIQKFQGIEPEMILVSSSSAKLNPDERIVEPSIMVVSTSGVLMDPSVVCSPFSIQQLSLQQSSSEGVQKIQEQGPIIPMVQSCSDFCDVVLMAHAEYEEKIKAWDDPTKTIQRSFSDSSGPFLLEQIERRHVNNMMVFMFRGQQKQQQIDEPEKSDTAPQEIQDEDVIDIVERIEPVQEGLHTSDNDRQQEIVEDGEPQDLITMEEVQEDLLRNFDNVPSSQSLNPSQFTSIAICTREISEELVQMFQGLGPINFQRGSGVFLNPKLLLQAQQTLSPNAHTFALPASVDQTQQPIPLATLPQPLLAPPQIQTFQPQQRPLLPLPQFPYYQPQAIVPQQFPSPPNQQPWLALSQIPHFSPPQYYQHLAPYPWYRPYFYPRQGWNQFGTMYPHFSSRRGPLWYQPQLQTTFSNSANAQYLGETIPPQNQSQDDVPSITSCEIMDVGDQVGPSSKFYEESIQKDLVPHSQEYNNHFQGDVEPISQTQPTQEENISTTSIQNIQTREDSNHLANESCYQDMEDTVQDLQGPIQEGDLISLDTPQTYQQDAVPISQEEQHDQQNPVCTWDPQQQIEEYTSHLLDRPLLNQNRTPFDSFVLQSTRQDIITPQQQPSSEEATSLLDEQNSDREKDLSPSNVSQTTTEAVATQEAMQPSPSTEVSNVCPQTAQQYAQQHTLPSSRILTEDMESYSPRYGDNNVPLQLSHTNRVDGNSLPSIISEAEDISPLTIRNQPGSTPSLENYVGPTYDENLPFFSSQPRQQQTLNKDFDNDPSQARQLNDDCQTEDQANDSGTLQESGEEMSSSTSFVQMAA